MTTDRLRQRKHPRLAAMFVVIGASISVLTLEHAAATTVTTETPVQIGESRSIERTESAITTTADEPAHTADVSVAGVAVAGVAIARAAPLSGRLDTDIASRGPNPLALLIALSAEAAMIATLLHRSRRAIL